MALDTQVVWGGLTLGGGGHYKVEQITGWDDLPELVDLSQPRSRGHGDHVDNLYAGARIVTVSGSISSPAARDALAQALLAVSPVSSTVTDLSITSMGQTLTAGARLIRRSLPVGDDYPAGKIPWALQWRCPDPLRYGPLQTTSTGLPVAGAGGLAYPLTYPLDYGTSGTSGQLTLTNNGTADASILFTVLGSEPQGFSLAAVGTGAELRYPYNHPAGAHLLIDTGVGSVLYEGTSNRRGQLTRADWLQVPRLGSLTVQFVSLGGAYDPGASATAQWRSASW